MKPEQLLEYYDHFADAPDAVPRLRQFILDLAVHGKLVKQDPSDEPASKLMARIKIQQNQLLEDGTIRNPKKLPIVDPKPFDLPQCWEWTRIREVTSDRGQKIPDKPFIYLDVTSIDKEAGLVSSPKELNPDESPSRARKIVACGDVIYSCVRPYLLNVAVIENDYDPEPIASTAFAVLNGYGLVVPRFIWIVLRSPFMVKQVKENQRGLSYPAINDKDFSLLPFPLPPLAEQHRIVAKVNELLALCDRLVSASNHRENIRQRLLMSSLFQAINQPSF